MAIFMIVHEFGDPSSDLVLVQPVDRRDLEMVKNEIKMIADLTAADVRLMAVEVDSWNADLSPWRAPAVFGKEDFGDGAANTLAEIEKLCEDKRKTYYLGGYSLAGLFSLWAAYRTDRFKGVAAVSPSLWFPGFLAYMKENKIRSSAVCLSLGDKEEKTRNPIMATVGDRTREAYQRLNEQGVDCVLAWNEGNHFKDAEIRTAKAFAWLLKKP